MLDTGATDVAIPQELAARLKLEKGFGVTLTTANGLSEGYRTRIDRLQLGDIVLRNVRTLVAQGLGCTQVLLGMSAVYKLDSTPIGRKYVRDRGCQNFEIPVLTFYHK